MTTTLLQPDLQRKRDEFMAEQAAARADRAAQLAQADELARQRAELEPKQDAPSIDPALPAMDAVVAMLQDDSVKVIPATLLVAATAELDAASVAVTMASISAHDPSDDEIICTAARAVADAYDLTFGQAVQRLSSLDWSAE